MRAPDYRKLLWIRLTGQGGDGIFLVALTASVVFNAQQQNTARGLLVTTMVTIAPFTLLGPFVGVFIDRWSRRRILTVAPLLKVAFVPLLLFDPLRTPAPFFLGALAILSINRFQLAAASAVVPRLVPAQDLLLANSIATVGGTLASLLANNQLPSRVVSIHGFCATTARTAGCPALVPRPSTPCSEPASNVSS